MDQEPKISITEIVFITPLFVLFDSIGIALVSFGIDDFFLLDIIRFPVSQIYLRMKGVKGTTTLVGNILESIPYVGALPISTICWLITVYLDRNPESIAAKGIEMAGKMKKADSQTPATNRPSAKNTAFGEETAGRSLKPNVNEPITAPKETVNTL